MTEFEFLNHAHQAAQRCLQAAKTDDERKHYADLSREAWARLQTVAAPPALIFKPLTNGAFDIGRAQPLPAMPGKAQGLNMLWCALFGHSVGAPCRLRERSVNGMRNALRRAADHAERFGAFDLASAALSVEVRGDGHLALTRRVAVELM